MRSNSYTLERAASVSASAPVASVPESVPEPVSVASVLEPVASAWATEGLVVDLPVAPPLLLA